MKSIECATQAELDAVPAGTLAIVRKGFFRAWGSATVEAWDSATVRAWDSATVRAGGSATVRAWDSATVEAGGSATVHSTSPVVPIQTKGPNVTVTGKGIVIPVDMPGDPEGWCERQGVDPDGDTAVLYKVVGPDWKSGCGMAYEPGTTVEAPDWDPEIECGGGLHFVGQPFLTAEWDKWNGEGHIVACRVRMDEIVVHPDGVFPNKVKAPRVLEVFEVDRDGNRIEGA